MHRITRYCATALALVAFTAPAFAQSQAPAGDPARPNTEMQDRATPAPADSGTAAPSTDAGPTFVQEQSPDELTVDDLVGMPVVNAEGEEVGDIEDLVFDDGAIVAAVISVGGFLGIGAKNVGVAWSAVNLQKLNGERVALLDLSKQELEQAPEFKPFRPAPPPPAATGGTGTMPSPSGAGGN